MPHLAQREAVNEPLKGYPVPRLAQYRRHRPQQLSRADVAASRTFPLRLSGGDRRVMSLGTCVGDVPWRSGGVAARARYLNDTPIKLVPGEGLEPSQPCDRRILSPLRLPIPPFRRGGAEL